MDKHLHIVAFDVPCPVDYGGITDVFYKLVALHEAGVRVHLHCFDCFEQSRGRQAELEKHCVEVNYYQRQEDDKAGSHKLPYAVAIRASNELLNRLAADDYPVLLEGVQCSYLLHDKRFTQRKIILRPHSVAYQHYQKLCSHSGSPLRKLYYWHESRRWKQYESVIASRLLLVPANKQDMTTYQALGARDVQHLPVFLPFDSITSMQNVGCFCLYHGDLSQPENERAALWLTREVFNDLPVHFIVAGSNPSRRLERAVSKPHTCLVANPSGEEMQDLIRKAQVHTLPSFSGGGVPLKLLNALFCGRHCVVNDKMVDGSSLRFVCHIAPDAKAFQSVIMQLFNKPFDYSEIQMRKRVLEEDFNNEQNCRKLMAMIWD